MKNHFSRLLFLSATISLILFSCKKNDNVVGPVESDPALYGKVIDEQGNPVAGVKVHYIPMLVNLNLAKSALLPPSTTIQFSIPKATKVTLVILRHGTQDTLLYIYKDEVMDSGVHGVNINGDKLTNGVYDYVIKFDSTLLVRKFLMLQKPEALINTIPLTTTDNEGKFKLTYLQLGIGEVFETSSLSDPLVIYKKVLSDSLQIFLVKDGYGNYLEGITIDTNSTSIKNFTIKKQ